MSSLRCTVVIVLFCDFTVRFSITGLQRASGTSCTVSSILATLVPSHCILYCYDIPQYIVTFAITNSLTRQLADKTTR